MKPLHDHSTNLVFIRYCAALIASGNPVMVTVRSIEPSSAPAIFILAPDNCLHWNQNHDEIVKNAGISSCHQMLLIKPAYNGHSEREIDAKYGIIKTFYRSSDFEKLIRSTFITYPDKNNFPNNPLMIQNVISK